MTAAAKRPTEPVCPPWCAGHDDRYQAWETDRSGRRVFRFHSNGGQEVAGFAGVSVVSEETEHGVEAGEVALWLQSEEQRLTPADARRVAAALLNAADDVEAHQQG